MTHDPDKVQAEKFLAAMAKLRKEGRTHITWHEVDKILADLAKPEPQYIYTMPEVSPDKEKEET